MSNLKSPKPEEATFRVRVVPRSSQSKVELQSDGALKVWVNAPPVDGAANDAVCQVIAQTLRVPKSAVDVVSGHTSRTKTIRVSGLTPAEASFRLGA